MEPLKSSHSALLRSLVAILVMSGAVSTAQENDSAAETKSKATTVDGVFESVKAVELSADTEQVKSLEIKRIIAHGSVVSKGQNLIWFETEAIDDQIEEAESALRLAELEFRDQEFAYKQFIETQKLDRQAADRSHKKAKQDYDNFVQVDRERQIETANYNLTNAQASLENAQEELQQLEQMYKEDDLTEESEEIVLKRAKQSVENAKYRLRGTRISTDRSLKQDIPRATAEQEESLSRAQMAHAKAIRDLESARQKRDLEMKKKRDEIEEKRKDFEELQAERKRSVLQAPFDGVVFHGELNRGKVGEKPSTLEAGSTVSNKQVVLTVAEPGKLQIRVDLQEKDLPVVSKGVKAIVRPTAFPEKTLQATVKSVSAVPYAGGKYDCVLAVRIPGGESSIMPAMTCKVEFASPDDSESNEKSASKSE